MNLSVSQGEGGEEKEKAEEESCQVPGPDSLEFAVLSAIFVCHYGGRRPRISN